MNIKKHIPNFITLGNLMCGVMGIQIVARPTYGNSHLEMVFLLMLIAAVFDFADGLAARLLRVSSELGKQLDSLADMVTFGVLPGMVIVYASHDIPYGLNYLGLLVPAFSALRLAKFNVDEGQSLHFKGVPTPANAMFIIGFYVAGLHHDPMFQHPAVFSLTVVLMSFLLVANIPLLALKFRSRGWRENRAKMLLVIISAVLLVFFQLSAIPLILPLYLVLSFLHFKLRVL